MCNKIDSSMILTLILIIFAFSIFVAGIISSVRLVKALENEEDKKNRP